jgi:hypothetical protein
MPRLAHLGALAGAVLLLPGPSAAVWAPTDGPEGFGVTVISVDDVLDRVYLGAGSSLYRSEDGGLTWEETGGTSGLANILSLHAQPGGVLLAGVSLRGVWWSNDGGNTWDHDQITHDPHTGLGASILAVAVSPNGAWLASRYRSTNGGASWNQMSIYGYDFVTSQGKTLAATNDGVYASTNDGVSWSASNAGIAGVYVQALAAGPGGHVYASVPGSGVFRSTDNGATWTAASNGLGSLDVNDLATDASGRVYAATANAGVYVSTDQAASWTPSPTPLLDAQTRAVATTASSDLYVGTASAGVAYSPDEGATWQLRNDGLPTRSLTAVTFASSGVGLVGSFGSGVFRSTDEGASWIHALDGLESRTVNAILETSSGDLLAATMNDVYRSDDNGLSWSPSGLAGERVKDLASSADGTLYAVAEVQFGTSTHVFRSVDEGETWVPVLDSSEVAMMIGFTSIVVDDTGRVFAGGDSFFLTGTILVSDDAGDTWTETSLGGLSTFMADLGTVDAGAVYALTESSGLYVTEDSGTTWTPLSTPWSQNAQVLAVTPNGELWVGTGLEGVFRSDDGGASWSAFNDGFGSSLPSVSALALHDVYVYAGTTYRGLFRSPTDPTLSVPDATAAATRLLAPRPNPFSAEAIVTYEIATPGAARIDVFAVDGRHVRTLLDGVRPAGRDRVVWDGQDARGRRVSPGSYVVRVETAHGASSRVVTVVR